MARTTFPGTLVDVSFDGAVCAHAGECTRGMPEVFDTSSNPWIHPERADTPELAEQLRDVVASCPSGALQIED